MKKFDLKILTMIALIAAHAPVAARDILMENDDHQPEILTVVLDAGRILAENRVVVNRPMTADDVSVIGPIRTGVMLTLSEADINAVGDILPVQRIRLAAGNNSQTDLMDTEN